MVRFCITGQKLYIAAMYYNIHTHNNQQYQDVVTVYNQYDNFHAPRASGFYTAGLHPWYLSPATWKQAFNLLQQLLADENLLAIGECGLDKLTATDWTLQSEVFSQQIALAQQYRKPLIIHCVKAFPETLQLLQGVTVPVVFHGINNKRSIITPVIEAGHYLSFGKALLEPNAAITETFLATPLSQLFLETDDADLDIKDLYKSAAKIRNIDEKEILLQLEANFNTVFHHGRF
jgi:TatD DNase family protein